MLGNCLHGLLFLYKFVFIILFELPGFKLFMFKSYSKIEFKKHCKSNPASNSCKAITAELP